MTAAGGWELVTEVDAQNPDLGDLRVSGTQLARLATFGAAVAQACGVELGWWLGEWFLDRRRGVPYLTELLRRGVTEATVRVVLVRVLLRVQGVAQVAAMDIAIDRQTRRCSVTGVQVVTTEGELVDVGDMPLGGGA